MSLTKRHPVTLDDTNLRNTFRLWHFFIIGQYLSAFIGILYELKDFGCPHSFLFNISKVKFFVAD